MSNRNLIWLVSYPKSGNTWLRTLLTNYIRNANEPTNINDLDGRSIVVSRYHFDETIGIESSDLTHDEIEYYRPQFCREVAASNDDLAFIKVHDAYTQNRVGKPLFPPDVTKGVIYLVRNPLDIVASYAHHSRKSVDEIIDLMVCDNHGFDLKNTTISSTLPVRLLSWSNHICSWLDVAEPHLLVVRYEDLLINPAHFFSEVLQFSGIKIYTERLGRAITLSNFSALRTQEKKHGFSERQPTAKSFFRKGRSEGWKNELTNIQIERVVNQHGNMMDKFGYLP